MRQSFQLSQMNLLRQQNQIFLLKLLCQNQLLFLRKLQQHLRQLHQNLLLHLDQEFLHYQEKRDFLYLQVG